MRAPSGRTPHRRSPPPLREYTFTFDALDVEAITTALLVTTRREGDRSQGELLEKIHRQLHQQLELLPQLQEPADPRPAEVEAGRPTPAQMIYEWRKHLYEINPSAPDVACTAHDPCAYDHTCDSHKALSWLLAAYGRAT